MLDEKDLLAIGQLFDQKLDQKLTQQKQEILSEVDLHMGQKLAQQKQEILSEVDLHMDQKLAQQKEEILTETTHRMKVLLDAEIKPMFNLLAEDLSIIREKMIPESRIEALEDDVSVLKTAVRQINREIRELKKAQ